MMVLWGPSAARFKGIFSTFDSVQVIIVIIMNGQVDLDEDDDLY